MMMKKFKHISLKEYETTNIGDLNSQDIAEVEKINKSFGKDIFEIKANNCIKARQYIGVVNINNKQIEVLPKTIGDEKDQIVRNLLFMLSYTKHLQIDDNIINNIGEVDSLFEIFVYIFSKGLFELLKREPKKDYHNIEENSSFLRGKILFNEHIKYNSINKSQFYVRYETMDMDFLLNIFLKSICSKLIKWTKSRESYKVLNNCLFILKDVDDRVFRHKKELQPININSKRFRVYKNIYNLGQMLYFGNAPDFGRHTSDNFFVIFDANRLFEEFIFEFISENKRHLGIKSIKSQISQKYVFLNNKFSLKPDIIIDFLDDTRLIIDTKYKKLDSIKNYNGVTSSDIYQMFTYGMRYFENHIQKNIILLYPKYNQDFNDDYKSIENINIGVRTIDLSMDLGSDEGKNILLGEIGKILSIETVSFTL